MSDMQSRKNIENISEIFDPHAQYELIFTNTNVENPVQEDGDEDRYTPEHLHTQIQVDLL